MSKKQAERLFKSSFELEISLIFRNHADEGKGAWENFLSQLLKEGRISINRYAKWGYPKFLQA